MQGHCFGPTSFRCKDLAAESPSLTLNAGTNLTLTLFYQAFHPGDCSVYISYDAEKDAPISWLALAHIPGCVSHAATRTHDYSLIALDAVRVFEPCCGQAGGQDRTLVGPTTLSFNVTLPPWLASCAHCVLRWEWVAVHQPAAGPQQYLDCVDVSVVGTSDTSEAMLRRVRPVVNITNGAEHLRGNGLMRFPYGAHRRQFGLQYMAGGQATPGGPLAVATLIDPAPPLPPPPPGTTTSTPPPPPSGAASASLPSHSRNVPQSLTEVCDQPAFSSRSNLIVAGRSVACSVLLDVPTACARPTSSSYDPSCAIVFFFHGAGGNSMSHFWRTRDIIHTTTAAQQLIGVFLQGAGRVWNTAGQSTADDMAFVLAIITRLRALGATGRLYAFGSSNGAALAQRIGTNGGLGFTGIVASATQLSASPERYGPPPHDYNYPTVGSATRGVAVLMLHGSADTTIPIGGGRLFQTSTYLASTADTMQLWAHVNGCTGAPSVNSLSATYGAATTTSATLTAFTCPATTPVEYVETRCAGHGGAASINGVQVMQYVATFIHRVESACGAAIAGEVGACDNPRVYSPSAATAWPVYSAPTCTDTQSSCTCTPRTTTSWMPLPSQPQAPSPPSSLAPPQCAGAPSRCLLTAEQAMQQKCSCSYKWNVACSEPVAAELRCE